MRVYLDLAVLINFFVDFLLLLGTNRLSGFPLEPARSALAAAFGGIYGGVCILNSFRFLGGLFWRLVFLSLISGAAFGFRPSAVKRCGVFILLSMSLGGIAVAVGRVSIFILIGCGCFLLILCRMAFGGTVGGRNYLPLTITYGEKTASLVALCDSGNTLRDPVTGESVFVISGGIASSLTGLTPEELSAPLETIAKQPVPGLRLIPYRSVGCESGMLLALRFEEVKLGGSVRNAVIAFAPQGLGKGEGYQALVTGENF